MLLNSSCLLICWLICLFAFTIHRIDFNFLYKLIVLGLMINEIVTNDLVLIVDAI